MMTNRIPMFVLVYMFLAGCGPQAAAPNLPGPSSNGGLQVWVDAPLEGTTLTLPAVYTAVCHATDPQGVSRLEFIVNGSQQGTQENPSAAEKLFTGSFPWQPAATGIYTLGCRALNSQADWSGTATVQVTVLGEGTVTPLPTFTPSATPSPSFTPTMTPSPTATPTSTPTSVGLVFDHAFSSSEFFYPYVRGCIPIPGSENLSTRVSGSPAVSNAYLFIRLQDNATGQKSDWNDGLKMTNLGGQSFELTVTAADLPMLDLISRSGHSAVFLYQFVVYDSTGALLGRSSVYSDIKLSPCQ